MASTSVSINRLGNKSVTIEFNTSPLDSGKVELVGVISKQGDLLSVRVSTANDDDIVFNTAPFVPMFAPWGALSGD